MLTNLTLEAWVTIGLGVLNSQDLDGDQLARAIQGPPDVGVPTSSKAAFDRIAGDLRLGHHIRKLRHRALAVHRATIGLGHATRAGFAPLPSLVMGLWTVSVRLGREIAGEESVCVRSKLGPYALMPETGYGEPPNYQARGAMLLRLEAANAEEAGSIALASVRAAATECNVNLEPDVRSVSPSLRATPAVAPAHHARRAAAVKDPGSFYVAEAI